MFFGYKKYQKWGCHGQKSEFFSNAHIYSPRQDFLVSFIFSISGFVWLESRLIDFGGGSECIPLVCLAHTGRGIRSLSPKEKYQLNQCVTASVLRSRPYITPYIGNIFRIFERQFFTFV